MAEECPPDTGGTRRYRKKSDETPLPDGSEGQNGSTAREEKRRSIK
jgi:hypothetical protein